MEKRMENEMEAGVYRGCIILNVGSESIVVNLAKLCLGFRF